MLARENILVFRDVGNAAQRSGYAI